MRKTRQIFAISALVFVLASSVNANVFKRQVDQSNEVDEEDEDESCGLVTPAVRHYIYGGKQTMIEQWPWQVRHFFAFHIFHSPLGSFSVDS